MNYLLVSGSVIVDVLNAFVGLVYKLSLGSNALLFRAHLFSHVWSSLLFCVALQEAVKVRACVSVKLGIFAKKTWCFYVFGYEIVMCFLGMYLLSSPFCWLQECDVYACVSTHGTVVHCLGASGHELDHYCPWALMV